MGKTWTDPSRDPRTYGHPQGELATYREYLTNYRHTVELKCQDLDPEQLARRSVPPSTLSLLGLVRHLAQMENHWFTRVLSERPDTPQLYLSEDDDPDFDGAEGTPECVAEAFATWRRVTTEAEVWLDKQGDDSMGLEVPLRDGTVSVRDVLVHVIEEYARHCGQADLLRECIDGRTGL